ncbi:hypothetical protein [Streptomyces sp. NPDC002547]
MSTPIDDATRATVRQLAATGASNRAIARQLGIHHKTVARARGATDEAPSATVAPATPAPASATEAPPAPPAAPTGELLVLTIDEPLRQALATLRATSGATNTVAHNQAVARAAIRLMADSVSARRQEDSAT